MPEPIEVSGPFAAIVGTARARVSVSHLGLVLDLSAETAEALADVLLSNAPDPVVEYVGAWHVTQYHDQGDHDLDYFGRWLAFRGPCRATLGVWLRNAVAFMRACQADGYRESDRSQQCPACGGTGGAVEGDATHGLPEGSCQLCDGAGTLPPGSLVGWGLNWKGEA